MFNPFNPFKPFSPTELGTPHIIRTPIQNDLLIEDPVLLSDSVPEFDLSEWNSKLKEGSITLEEWMDKLDEFGIDYIVNKNPKDPNKLRITVTSNDGEIIFNVILKSTTEDKAPSEAEIQKAINNVISAFAKGNMTYEEAKSELSKVGISISTPLSKDDNDATQSYFEFTYNGVEYCVACNTEAIQNSKDNKTVTIWSQEEIKQQNFTKEQLNKYFQGVAWKQGAESALYYRAKSDWPEGVNTPAELKAYLNKPSVPTFKKEELAGLDDNAIKRYLTVNSDGTYSLNEANVKADFPEKDYGKIDTPAKLKEAIAKKAGGDKTESLAGAGGGGNTTKGDFNTEKDMRNYLFSGILKEPEIANLKFDKGFSNSQIADIVAKKHTKDFASVTKAQLKAEFIEEYNKKAGSTGGSNNDGKTTGDFADYDALKKYLSGSEFRGYIHGDGKITDFSLGFTYDDIVNTVAKAHEKDFASVTKEQLKKEFIAEYNRRAAGTPPTDDNDEVTFTKEELTGLDDNAVEKYFLANPDGTYSLDQVGISQDFPEKDYGKIETPAQLKEAIAKKTKGDGNKPTDNIGDFADYNELSCYLFNSEGLKSDADIKKLVFVDKGFNFEQVAEAVRSKHKDDFASVTKEQLKEEFIEEYNKKAGGTGGADDTIHTFKKEELAGLDDNAIKRYFNTIDGNRYSLNEANVKADFPEKDYGKIDTPAKLKEAIAKKAGGDKTSSAAGAGGTGGNTKTYPSGFKNWDECWQSIQNGDIYTTVSDSVQAFIGDTDIKTVMDKYYKTACEQLKSKLQNGFATDTKDKIVADLTNEVLKLKKADDDDNAKNSNPVTQAATKALEIFNNNVDPWSGEPIAITGIDTIIRVTAGVDNDTKLDTAYTIDANGKIKIKNSTMQTLYDKVLNVFQTQLKESGLSKSDIEELFKTAYISVTSTISNSSYTVQQVLQATFRQFKEILTSLKNKPEYLDLYKSANGTASTITTSINCSAYYKTNDNAVHFNDNNQDAIYQKALKQDFEALCKKYPKIPQSKIKSMLSSAVEAALKDYAGATKPLNELMQCIMNEFNKALYNELARGTISLDGNKTPAQRKFTDAEITEQNKFKNAADKVIRAIGNVEIDSKYDGYYWLTMNKVDGKLSFADKMTQDAYDSTFSKLCSKPDFKDSGLTESELKLIYDSAWMRCYRNRNNNEKYKLKAVLEDVLSNMTSILNKIKQNPEYLSVIKNTVTAYSYTSSAGTTEVLYEGTDTSLDYGDGNVHLKDDTADKQYQTAVSNLKAKLKQSYCPPLSDSQFDAWFYSAQQDAIKTCQNNSRDLFNHMQVRDGTRHKDHSKIQLGMLMELIVYNFQKQMFKKTF